MPELNKAISPGSDTAAAGWGAYTFTFQAVGVGKTSIELEYTSLYGQPTDAFEHTFTVAVTVEPARTLGN